MTRSEALHKLLALGPVKKSELVEICGWPIQTLDRLLMDGFNRGYFRRSGPRRNRTFELTFEVMR